MFNLTPVVKGLLIANVVVFLAGMFTGLDTSYLMGLRYLRADTFAPHQFITYMFAHADFRHILFNMLGIMFFGPYIELTWGARNFLIFYAVCGLGAGVFYSGVHYYELKKYEDATAAYVANPTPDGFVRYLNDYNKPLYHNNLNFIDSYDRNPDNTHYIDESIAAATSGFERAANTPMVGASGALFGILIAFGLLFPNLPVMLFLIPIPIKAKYVVAFYGLTAILGAIQKSPGDNVAHFAHLGGMLFGWLAVRYLKRYNQH